MTFKFFTTEGQTDVPGCFFHHDFLGTHGSVENFLCENYTFWHDFLIDWPFKSVNISYMYMVHLIENCEILCIISKQSCISYIFPVINQYFLWTMSLHPRGKKQPGTDKQTNWVTSSLLELLIAAKNSVLIKMVECYFHSYKRLHIISFLFFFYGSYLKFFKVSNLWTFGNVNVISNNILKKKKLVLRIFSNKTKMRSSCLVSDYFLFVY